MNTFDAKIWRQARRALGKAVQLHLDDPNVSHIDLGFRTRTSHGHSIGRELVVRVHVRRKLYGEAFKRFAERHPHWVIDAQRIGFAVDVPEAGYAPAWRESESSCHGLKTDHSENGRATTLEKHRATLCGGAVYDPEKNQAMFLTTRYALINACSAARGKRHPASHGGSDDRMLGTVEYVRDTREAELDAALARLHGRRLSCDGQKKIRPISGPAIPQLGMRVVKMEPNGENVTGIITGIMGCGLHRDDGELRFIRHIIHIAPEIPGTELCVADDSGAWWLAAQPDETYRVVGLHIAGSENLQCALAHSMPEVLAALNVDIVADETENCLAQSVAQQTDAADVGRFTSPANTAPFSITRIAKNVQGKFAETILLALFLLGSASFCYQQLAFQESRNDKAVALLQTVESMQASVQIDSLRRCTMRKIVAIISKFNPGMTVQLKHAIAEEIHRMSLKYPNLDIDLVCATITHESGLSWNPRVVSSAGAMGLMQIMPSTGAELAGEEGIIWTTAEEILFDPVLNIRLGSRYLSTLVGAYNVDGGLAAYNGGQTRAARWVRNGRMAGILHAETAGYVPAIMKIYEQYRRMSI